MTKANRTVSITQLVLDEEIYQNNSRLTSAQIGKAIGRSRQAVDIYIADLRAVSNQQHELKILWLHSLGIPQERITQSLGLSQQLISKHLQKMPILANFVNTDLKRGFTVPQVAENMGGRNPLSGH